MNRPWDVDSTAQFHRRLDRTAAAGGESRVGKDCPEIWELSNGDVAVVGRDATALFHDRMPADLNVAPDERLVVIPGPLLRAATEAIADA